MGQRRDVVYKGDGRVGESRVGVVLVSSVLGLFWGGAPVEVEEEKGFGGNLPMRQQGGTMGREGWDGFRETCHGRVYLRGRPANPYASKAALVAYKSG